MKHIQRAPDIIITNKKDLSNVHPALLKRNIVIAKRLEEYIDALQVTDLITLHGYLRIVPASVCNKFVIYNGHPGLINVYPDLKGKDPQQKAFEKDYTRIGSVIHRCTEELDSGEIVKVVETALVRTSSLQDYYNALKETSLQTWIEFFKEGRLSEK
jgi:folate-dependent phosphoribosylglycinamide formyltransferase PurN